VDRIGWALGWHRIAVFSVVFPLSQIVRSRTDQTAAEIRKQLDSVGGYPVVGDDVVGMVAWGKGAVGSVGKGIAGNCRVIGKVPDAEAVGEVEQSQMGIQSDASFTGDAIDAIILRNDRAFRRPEVVIGKAQLFGPIPFQLQ
jgi:hypothetical protein